MDSCGAYVLGITPQRCSWMEASARNRVLNSHAFAAAGAIAAVLIDNAIPSRLYHPTQAGACQPGRGRVPNTAASSAEVDAEGEVVVPRAMAAHAYRQQARTLEPVRHAQVAGVLRAQSEALDER
jgi:hypothetical protein